MAGSWHFREFKPGDNASDPDFTKALFSKGGEDTLAIALVREAIQNSLDARSPKNGVARVRFAIRTGRNAASAAAAKGFFDALWPHLNAKNSGLKSPPAQTSTIPFLVVEDFGTSGLTGNVAQWAPFGSEKNPFFLFFRALGRSGKEGEDRGRWGVGKFVFPLASAASAWFGYTVPVTTSSASLMGRVVLKTHGTEQLSFHPDGHWGLRAGSTGLVMPETDARVLTEFRALFALKRISEPGLSIVVPWLAAEITAKAIALAATTEYFMPILRGELIVTIDDNGKVHQLDKSTLISAVDEIEDETVRARVELATAIASWPAEKLFVMQHRPRYSILDWDESWLSEAQSAEIREAFEAGLPVGVRVPIELKKKSDDPPVATFFDVYLRQTEALARQRPLIVREGITISEEKTVPLQGYSGLVIVENRPLASFVGDAESPAHNELQYQLVKDQYTYAGKVLQFLRGCPAEVVRTVERASTEDDPFLLAEFFPLPDATDTRGRGPKQPTRKRGRDREPDPNIPPARPARFRVSKLEGGFKVRGVPDTQDLPSEITIRCAYDVRRGNPLKRFKPFDFSLTKGELKVVLSDAEVIEQEENRILIRPLTSNFECSVVGFDVNRNVFVKVDAA